MTAGWTAVTAQELVAVRAAAALSLPDALAWFASAAGAEPVIGHLYAPDRAQWFRLHGGDPHGPAGPLSLDGAFEAYATDGSRQLRWVHDTAGTGAAVCLAEDPTLLPDGVRVAPGQPRQRWGEIDRRFAGTVIGVTRDGHRATWATLAVARYGTCQVPVTADEGQQVWATSTEYVTVDGHGNVTIVDTLLTGLHARSPEVSAAEVGRSSSEQTKGERS